MSFVDNTDGGDAQRKVHTTSHGGSSSITTVSIWSEKINGKGEDGPPLILLSDDYSFGVIAVSDGVGGAGSRQVCLDGELASGAKLAATKLLDVILAFFKDTWLQDPYNVNTAEETGRIKNGQGGTQTHHSERTSVDADINLTSHDHMGSSSLTKVASEGEKTTLPRAGKHESTMQLNPYLPATVGNCSAYLLSGASCGPSMHQDIELLSKTIDNAFEEMNHGLAEAQSSSRLRTKMQRNLPSTLAGWVYRATPEREITAFWAGDSRCYILSDDGLRQVSRDDAKGDFDAFEAIREDPPLTNYISERIPNSIKRRRFLYNNRTILICASDGAFNYLPTPMDFEFVILNSLMSSENMQIWADGLAKRLQSTAGDDISIILHPLGFDSFDDLKLFYKRRLDELKEQFVEPLETLHEKQAQLEKELASLRTAAKEKTKEVWDQYRVTYEQFLHEGDS